MSLDLPIEETFKSNSSKKEVSNVDTLRLVYIVLLKQVTDKMKNFFKLVVWYKKLQKSTCIGTSFMGH